MDREAFLKGLSLPEREVELSVGVVTVRGLSRAQVIGLQALRDDLGALERTILHLGFVEPELSPEDVDLWYGNALSDDVDSCVSAISELSGIAPGSPKSGVSGVREGQRS